MRKGMDTRFGKGDGDYRESDLRSETLPLRSLLLDGNFNETGTRWGNAMQWIMGYCFRRRLYYKLEHNEETVHWIMHVWFRKEDEVFWCLGRWHLVEMWWNLLCCMPIYISEIKSNEHKKLFNEKYFVYRNINGTNRFKP